jgi:hypothetical protein
MLRGWDKKCYEYLKELKGAKIYGGYQKLVDSFIERYEDNDTHFFSEHQRQIIRSLVAELKNRDKTDARLKKTAQRLRGLLNEEDTKLLEELMEIETLGFQSRNKLRNLIGRYKGHAYQKILRDRLEKKYKEGTTREDSGAFIMGLLEWFDTKNYWTAVQEEHVEKILVDNRDPS